MTNLSPPAGSSLPQARHQESDSSFQLDLDHTQSDSSSEPGAHILSTQDSPDRSHSNSPAQPHSHSHSHLHSHDRRRLGHTHGRAADDSLPRRQAASDDGATDELTDADASAAPSLVTQVVQTVSLIQVVDGLGSPIETRTLYAPPATVVVDPSSGLTVSISAQDGPATSAAPAADPASSDNGPAESSAGATDPTSTTTLMSASTSLSLPQSLSNLSLNTATGSQGTAVTTPSANGSVFPSVAGIHNATNTAISANDTTISTASNNSSMFKILDHTSTTSSSPTTLSFTSSSSGSTHTTTHSSSSSFSETILSTISSDSPSSTLGVDGGAGGGGSQPSSTAEAGASDDNSGPDLSPQDKKVIGGVVGGVAAAAFFLLLVLLALKYKKKKDAKAASAGDLGGAASRGITDGGSGGGSGGGMTERSAPFGVAAATAALASLAGKRNTATTVGSEGGERGFYRVSGRKLPSVLQAGGDGYTDPRGSVMSGTSDYYRGSQAFEPISGGSTRLALGSPMRPVSGVAIMRSGPARTAVTENPFDDPFDDPPPSPPPVLDPLGRTLAGQDGSRGSGSRFQEEI